MSWCGAPSRSAALWLARTRRDVVALWAWRVSGGLAVALALVVQVLLANPIFDKADVGRLPHRQRPVPGLCPAGRDGGPGAALDRRRAEPQRGAVRRGAPPRSWPSPTCRSRSAICSIRASSGDGLGASGLELYVYSAVWLLFGVALLALGFLRNAAALRHAGMALVCVVVAKVFLIDMAGLQGLLRVFSFLGLGAALIGLGYAYRRFGFR